MARKSLFLIGAIFVGNVLISNGAVVEFKGGESESKETTVSQRELIKLEEQIDLYLRKHDFVNADQLIEKWNAHHAHQDTESFYDLLFKALRGTDLPYVEQKLSTLYESDPDNLIYRYYQGVAHLHSSKFRKAERIFAELKSHPKINKQFRSLVQDKWENSRNGSIYVIEHPVIIKPEHDEINSEVDEYACATTRDGLAMAFTRYELSDTLSENGPKEVIYESHFDRKGKLNKQLRLFSENNQFHYSPLEYSLDQNTLYFFKGESHKTGNIHEATKENDTWIEKGVIEGFVNSEYWDSDITFSYDGTFAIFSSNRPGGFGGRDLYSAKLQPNGTWGEVMNLGPSINTEKNEDSPFFRKDDKMLYFSSNGHSGIGGMDVFYSKFESGQFSYPKNIGYPINTAGDDKYFSVNSTGQKARYSSTIGKESNGGYDIYNIFNEPTCKNDPPELTILDVKVHGDVNDIDKIEILNDDKVIFTGSLKKLKDPNSFVLKNGTTYEIKLSGPSNNYSEWLDLSNIESLHHTEKNIGFFGKNNVAMLSDTLIPGPHHNRNREDFVLSVLDPDDGNMLALELEDIPLSSALGNLDRTLTIFGKKFENANALMTKGNLDSLDKNELMARLNQGNSKAIAENNAESTNEATVKNKVPLKESPYFKNVFDFNQVAVSDERLKLNTFQDLIKTLKKLSETESEIWIHLESRASKVPTSKKGGNNGLAYNRGKEFRTLLLNYLDQNNISNDKLKFTYDAKVTGPAYTKEIRINDFIQHQYVAVYLRTNGK